MKEIRRFLKYELDRENFKHCRVRGESLQEMMTQSQYYNQKKPIIAALYEHSSIRVFALEQRVMDCTVNVHKRANRYYAYLRSIEVHVYTSGIQGLWHQKLQGFGTPVIAMMYSLVIMSHRGYHPHDINFNLS